MSFPGFGNPFSFPPASSYPPQASHGRPSRPEPAPGPSFSNISPSAPTAEDTNTGNPQFDVLEWHVAYQSCQRFFLDHAQYEPAVHAIAAHVNICLPFQRASSPIVSSSATPISPHPPPPAAFQQFPPLQPQYSRHGPMSPQGRSGQPAAMPFASLTPYVRRLVVTGWDKPGILHGFFGDDWRKGIGPIQECERRNYLFAAKSGGWEKVKNQYDMGPYETVPFLQPLQDAQLEEIEQAEQEWSKWLAMEDWMLGDRAPPETMEDEDTERPNTAGTAQHAGPSAGASHGHGHHGHGGHGHDDKRRGS